MLFVVEIPKDLVELVGKAGSGLAPGELVCGLGRLGRSSNWGSAAYELKGAIIENVIKIMMAEYCAPERRYRELPS